MPFARLNALTTYFRIRPARAAPPLHGKCRSNKACPAGCAETRQVPPSRRHAFQCQRHSAGWLPRANCVFSSHSVQVTRPSSAAVLPLVHCESRTPLNKPSSGVVVHAHACGPTLLARIIRIASISTTHCHFPATKSVIACGQVLPWVHLPHHFFLVLP